MKSIIPTALLAAMLLILVGSIPGCSGILEQYNVRFGLRADVTDQARDPNSVSMLEPTEAKRKRIPKPPAEILTTEGMDEALDDDLDNISPEAAVATQEKTKATEDIISPAPQ